MGLADFTWNTSPPPVVQSPAAIKNLSDSVPFWADGSRPDAFESLSAWDVLWVGGEPLPGLVRLEGARKIKIDRRDAPGSEGETLTFLGRDSSDILVKLKIWTPAQLAAWAKRAIELQPAAGTDPPKAYDVYHPGIAMIGIKSLYLLDCGIMVPTSVPDVFETQLRFIEFIPPKKVNLDTVISSRGSAKLGAGKAQAFPQQEIPSAHEAGP